MGAGVAAVAVKRGRRRRRAAAAGCDGLLLTAHAHMVMVHITILTPYKAPKVHQNVREVVLPDMDLATFSPNMFANRMMGPITMAGKAPMMCCDALAKRETQNLLKEKYDLIMLSMFFTECFLSVVHQMKVPFVQVCPAALFGPFAQMGGSVTFTSFAQNSLLPFTPPYTFLQRMIIVLSDVASHMMFTYYIVNSVKTLEVPAQPSVPTTIYCGGIHCRPSEPLPKDLEEWVAGAGQDGFIYFSLGSAVTPSDMPEEHRKILVEVFGSLQQRVLWKWNKDTMEDLPPNVRLGKWLPQQDILVLHCVKTLEVPAQPSVPTTIYCGGIHCRPSEPLPKDLEEWVAGAGQDGFIYFSLGSAVTPSDMPEEHRKILVEVFGSLQQRVLWKWNKDTMEDLPPNVRLGKWLPQQDILGCQGVYWGAPEVKAWFCLDGDAGEYRGESRCQACWEPRSVQKKGSVTQD
ncbi:UDP-glucuronosyltransferase 2B14 [Chionoecetes opilio]|uniref:UDP-glucuronosyltransferase 2B14 n=1 Tax=Chionoecetes opilio TaxID=41210 RepID=A0A8J5CJN1_CHIOP|nr:UDP-glucuronosyltransferase 2B14 [Chionoecetes opilio]